MSKKQNTKDLTMTVESRIDCGEAVSQFLEEIGAFYGFLKRKLFNDIFNVENIDDEFQNTIKKNYQKEYGIPARLFNALWREAKGMYDSSKILQEKNLADDKKRLPKIEKDIRYFSKKLDNKNLKYHEIQNTKQSLNAKQQKKNTLEMRIDSFEIKPVVFGSRDFYKKQWTDDKYIGNHDAWVAEWQRKRNGNFFLLGSHDECNSNSICQYMIVNGGEFLRVTLPKCLNEKYKREHIWVPVKFNSDCEKKNKKYYSYFHEALENKVAVSYRFIKKENGCWYVQAAFTLERNADAGYGGCLGVDLNYGLMATSETDAKGNFCGVMKNYDYDSTGKTTEQMSDELSRCVCDIVSRAKFLSKDVVIEDLDLEGKKSGRNKISNRKVSSIEYAAIKAMFINRCAKEGARLHIVNPAYTSIIGKYKYQKRFGISVHNAAAIVTARRGYLNSKNKSIYKERIPFQMSCVLRGGEENEWLAIHKHKHHWAQWSFLSKNLATCLTRFNSAYSGNAISMNTLTARFKPDKLSFLVGCRKEYFSIQC